jgi:DNA-directed RNA polymerase subunit beta
MVPDLLALQTESFDWLLGNDKWKSRVEAAKAAGRKDVPEQSGLEEIFEEISPIEDFSGTMSLSFRDHRFEPPKYSSEECKDKDMTYSAPMFVTAEFINNTTGEIKSQTVFMGDFPLMSAKGTFIINGTERVVVSQLVRSPGVYFDRQVDKTSDKDIYSCKVIPHRPQAQAERHRPAQGARLGRRPHPRAFRRLRVDARHSGEGPHHRPGRRAAGHLPQAAAG